MQSAGFVGTIATLFVALGASTLALLLWMAAIHIGGAIARSDLWRRIGSKELS